MYYRCGSEQIVQEKIIEVLGENLFNDLKEVEEGIKLDRTFFGYFDRCFKLNEVLAKHNYFLKFFERRDTCRFLIKKKVQGEIEVIRNISSSVLEKFNGYEMIRNNLRSEERAELTPVNVVYEPIYYESVPVPCYFTNEINLAYRSYVGTFNKGNEHVIHRTVRQCCFCQKIFAKNEENVKNHISIYSAREGITHAFDNGQILNYQDNFKYLGDLQLCFFSSKYVYDKLLSDLFISSVLKFR